MASEFRLLMISAMYENGGNTTQRLLDGHPELISYPFESQPGTKYVQDYLTSLYPVKYRWPVFPLSATPADDYETIIDEECKVRIKTPQSSKFRDTPMELDDRERKRIFVALMEGRPRTRANLVEAFFRSSAEAWKDRARGAREAVHVGYSPIIGVDADKIVEDLPRPMSSTSSGTRGSAYGDTKKRACRSIAHHDGLVRPSGSARLRRREVSRPRARRARRGHRVRPGRGSLQRAGQGRSEALHTLAQASWNGRSSIRSIPGARSAPTGSNKATAAGASASGAREIRGRTEPLLKAFGYAGALIRLQPGSRHCAGFIGAAAVRRLSTRAATHALLRPDADTWRLDGVLDRVRASRDVLDSRAVAEAVRAVRPCRGRTRDPRRTNGRPRGAHPRRTPGTSPPKPAVTRACACSRMRAAPQYGYKTEPMRETDRLEPNSVYAAVAKAAQTHLASLSAAKGGMAIVTFRLFSVYGP